MDEKKEENKKFEPPKKWSPYSFVSAALTLISLVLFIFEIFLSGIGFFVAWPIILLGFLGRREVRKKGLRDYHLGLVSIIFGILFLLYAILGYIFAFASAWRYNR